MAKKKPKKKAPAKRPRAKKPPPPPPLVPVELPPEDRELSDQERHFVQEFLVDRRASAAFRRVRPDVDARRARSLGSEMRHRPWVAAEIRAAVRAQAARLQVSADEVVEEVRRVAMSDIYDLFDPNTGHLRHPRDIPIDVRRSVASVRLSRERRTTVSAGATRTQVTESIVEVKLWPKMDALGKLMAHFGLTSAVPPLDALLSLLPTEVAAEIRELMLRRVRPVAPPPAPPSLASPPLTADVKTEPGDLAPPPPPGDAP